MVTDHANHNWLTTRAPQQEKVARWYISMAEFDFFIECRKGERNAVTRLKRTFLMKTLSCCLIAVCLYCNFLRAIPVTDKQATTAARALFNDVFLLYNFQQSCKVIKENDGLMQQYPSLQNVFQLNTLLQLVTVHA